MKYLFLGLFFCLSFSITATSIDGYYKVIGSYSKNSGELNNSLRLKMQDHIRTKYSYDFAYKLNMGYRRTELSSSIVELSQGKYRIADFDQNVVSHNLNNTETIMIENNLDRLSVAVSTSNFDLTIGRQAISFGSSKFVNPIDFLVPYNVDGLDVENRFGVDSIRFQNVLGEMGEVDVAVVAGNKAKIEQSAIYFSVKYPVLKCDTQVIYAAFKEMQLLGMDLQVDIFGAGLTIEGAQVITNNTEKFSRVSIGGEYRINEELVFFAEYHYNGAGTKKKNEYASLLGAERYSKGTIYLLAKDYLGFGVTYMAHALATFSMTALYNINDESVFGKIGFDYNFKENWYLDSGVMLADGNSSTEFSNYSNRIYMLLKYYF